MRGSPLLPYKVVSRHLGFGFGFVQPSLQTRRLGYTASRQQHRLELGLTKAYPHLTSSGSREARKAKELPKNCKKSKNFLLKKLLPKFAIYMFI